MHQGRRVLSWLTRLFFHNGVVITAQTSRRVSLPLIGPDSTSRFNHFVHCVPQRHGVGIRDDFDANATNTCLSFVFDGYQYQYLSESASSSFSRPKTPPRNTSSTSTSPLNRSRPGRTMAPLILCNRYQAVLYFLMPSTRARPSALTPFFCETRHQSAWNQRRSGMRLSPKVVPAVTEMSRRHFLHCNTPRRTAHSIDSEQCGHRGAPPQRTFAT